MSKSAIPPKSAVSIPWKSQNTRPEKVRLCGCRQALDRAQRALDLLFVERDILELPGEVVVVRRHVEMAVAGEVEEDRPALARLVGLPRTLERAVDRVRGLG